MHRTVASATVRTARTARNIPTMLVEITERELLVGTEVRWIDGGGFPIAANAADAQRQERFIIATDWEDVDA